MAIDPNQLAQEQEQRQRIDAGGAPTEFSKGPEQDSSIQLAGGATRAMRELLNRLGDARKPQVDVSPDLEGSAAVQPQRVPTPQEAGLVPDTGQFSETQTKRQLAPQVLSPEGVAEFEQRGLKAAPLEEVNVIKDANEALEDQQKALTIEDVKSQANKALTAEAKGTTPESALVDPELADQALTMLEQSDANIKTLADGGDFNFDYINSPDEVKKTITALSEVYSDQTNAAKRGYISNEVTAQKAAEITADEIGLTKSLLKRKVGDGSLNAETMLAARELLVRSAPRLTDLAQKIQGGTANATDRLQFRRQMAIHAGIQAQVKGAQTEAARTLQSFQIPVGGEMSAVEQAREAQRLLQESGGADVVDDMAAKLLTAKEKNGMKGVNTFAKGGWRAKTRQALSEAYLAGLLSNPATQVKNVVGSAAFMMYQLPAETIAGFYGAVIRSGRTAMNLPISPDQAYVNDSMLRFKGWMDSYKDAMRASSIAWNTEVPASEASRLDVETYASITGKSDSVLQNSIDYFGKATRIPFRLLLGADEFMKTISQRGELYVQANQRYQQAIREGKTVQEAQDEAGMLLLDPRAVSEELDYKAKYDTLQSDLGGFGKVTGAIQRFDIAGIPVGRYVLPFATAPTNSFLRTAEFMGINPTVYADIAGKNGAKAQQMAMGRLSVGGATMGIVADYAMKGQITGGMPSDPSIRDSLPPGWQPYSFVVRAEGFPEDMPLYDAYGRPNGPLKYVSYAGYEPVGGIIALTANTVQSMHKTRDPEVRNNLAAASIGSVVDYYKELPMLQGLSDVVFALEYGNFDQLFRGPAEAATIAGVPSPASALQRSFGRMQDPTVLRPRGDLEYYTEQDILETRPDGSYKFSLPDGSPDYRMVGMVKNDMTTQIASTMRKLSAYQSKDSFFRDEYDRNAPVYDTLGNVVGSNDVSLATKPGLAIFNNLSGVRIREGEEVPEFQQELMRLTAMTGKWPLSNPDSKEGIRLSAGAQSDLVNIAKNETPLDFPRVGELTFKEALTAMTTTTSNSLGRTYNKASDKERVTMLKELNKKYIDAAFVVLLQNPRYANMAQAYEDLQRLKDEQ